MTQYPCNGFTPLILGISTVFKIASFNSVALKLGLIDNNNAATPDTCGVAIDVAYAFFVYLSVLYGIVV